MSQDSDTFVYIRRLKRNLTLWRVFGILATLAAVAILFLDENTVIPEEDHIARLMVTDIIVNDRWRLATLDAAKTDDAVKALIVRINSPGGTVVGGEALYRHLREFAAEKPVVVVMDEVATSAGYMIALGSDRIFARQGTVTGSIGVLMQTAEMTGLMEMIGIKPEIIKSRPLKATPNPMEPLSEEGRAVAKALVLDMYDMFVDMVAERRAFTKAEALILADGRVYTGRQALANGLIDDIGGEAEAIAWLESEHEIKKELDVEDLKIDRPKKRWEELLEEATGFSSLTRTLRLDGLISVWHPDLG